MLSIVICSVNENYLSQVKESISLTAGVIYELLVWDNRVENKGICEVYNLLASKARYDTILFLHEDILFETNNWGPGLLNIFNNNKHTGVIGVAGAKYKSKAFSGWFTGIKEFDCANIVHRYSYGDEHALLRPNDATGTEEVVCVDGVFICSRKAIWEKIRFDEDHLKGFHFYDIDFSTRAAAISTIVVTYDILMDHITVGGDFGNKWVEASLLYHQLRKDQLPQSAITMIPGKAETRICKTWLDVLKHYEISWSNKWKWINRQRLLSKPSLYYNILKFLLYRPLGLRKVHKAGRKNG